ncbi:MAG TPA: hypothetical protein VFH70_01690 [Acidimicrobiales bacterium]|nr:hypothetical protein [Acidimicrobiales bacterium]
MSKATDITVSDLRKELTRTRSELAQVTRRLDQLARAFRMSAHLAIDAIVEPPAPDFD